MDFNPYRPGAGAVPEYLAGRADIIKRAVKSLQMVKVSYPARPIIYYGLRGVGKTVLLDTVENHALDLDIPCKYIEIKENEKYKFLKQLALCTYQLSLKLSSLNKISSYAKRTLGIIKAFSVKYGDIGFSVDIEPEIGSADTGDLDNDITELLLSVGYLAKKENKGAVLLIDEIQYIKTDEFESFMTAVHRLNQKSYPIAIFGAGLPKIVKIAGDVKSYAERLFNFQEIGSLDDEAAILALTEPLKRFNVSYEKDALCKILEVTQGYPYFLQEYGSCIWDMKEDESDISLKDVDNAYDDFIKQLDHAFFKTRHDRATPQEIKFMLAMAHCKALPCSFKDVAARLHRTTKSISPLRNNLIHKGFVYAVRRGEIDFTVPQFDQYLKRHYPDD